jgi:hypothetical protein
MIFPNLELRWLKVPGRLHLDGTSIVQDYERVLQYRTKVEVVDYSATDPTTQNYVRRQEWSPWIDVPEVDS